MIVWEATELNRPGQQHLLILLYNADKGGRGGVAKTLWDSPLEETGEEK
jgi:hypothetical protein